MVGRQVTLEKKGLVDIRLDHGLGIVAARHREVADIVPVAPQLHLAVQRLGVEASRRGECRIDQRLRNPMPLDEVKSDIFERMA
jgi:hypothetical protein